MAAAALVAADHLSDERIAAQIGVSVRTLYGWKRRTEFADEVDRIRDELRANAVATGIALREQRLLDIDWRRGLLKQIVRARAQSGSVPASQGGDTGLMVRKVAIVKVYEAPELAAPYIEDGDTPSADEFAAMVSEQLAAQISATVSITPTKVTVEVEEFALDTGLLSAWDKLEQAAAAETGGRVEKHVVAHSRAGEPDYDALTDEELDELDRLTAIAEGRADKQGG